MVATTRALHTVQDGSFSVQSGASSAEISRTIRDPADRETSRLAFASWPGPFAIAGCAPVSAHHDDAQPRDGRTAAQTEKQCYGRARQSPKRAAPPSRGCPFALSLRAPRSQGRQRLLSPEHVTYLVREQDHANPINLALRLGCLYRTAAHDAGPTSASVSLVDTIGNGKAPLCEPNM